MPSTGGGLDFVRTCQNCVVAKVRCIRQSDSHTCERCGRLSKDCVYRKARRRPFPSHKDSRIDALEAKLDRLLSTDQPGATQGSTPAGSSTYQSLDMGEMEDHSPTPVTPYTSIERDASSTYRNHRGSSTSSTLSRSATSSSIFDTGLCTIEQAEILLDYFRTSMTPHFPFVVIPPTKTAAQLSHGRSFLLLTILAVASHEDMLLQKQLIDHVKSAISERMILGGDTSIDILQGLLVFLAWTHYHPRPRQHFQWLHLAMSILADLTLDKPSELDSWKTSVNWHKEVTAARQEITGQTRTKQPLGRRTNAAMPSWLDGSGIEKRRDAQRTLDEYRAVLGCYFLTSSSCCLLQRRNPFPYSSYLEDMANYVARNAEYASDKYLPQLIKLQHIMERIDKLSFQRTAEANDLGSVVEIWAGGLKTELEMFKERLQFPISESYLLLSMFYTTELYLYQICLPDKKFPQNFSSTHWSPWRLEMLNAGFLGVKTHFQTYLGLPLGVEKAFGNIEWLHIGFELIVFAKLSVAAAAEPIARQTMNMRRSFPMSAVFNQLLNRVGSLVTPTVDARGDRDVFFHFELRTKGVRDWYESSFKNAEKLQQHQGASSGVSPTYIAMPPQTVSEQSKAPEAYGLPAVENAGAMPQVLLHRPEEGIMSMDAGGWAPDMHVEYYLPDTMLDEIMGEWTMDSSTPFEGHFGAT